MSNHKLLKYTISFTLFTAQLFGFWPYTFSSDDGEFHTSIYRKSFAIASPIFFFSAMMHSGAEIFANTTVEYSTDVANVLQNMFTVSCSVMFVMGAILSHWYRSKVATDLLPQSISLFRSICRRQQQPLGYADLLVKLFVKSIFISLAFFGLEYYSLDYYVPLVEYKFLQRLFLVIPLWTYSVLPNLFSGGMLAATHGYRLLNREMEQMIGEQHHQMTKHGRMARYCKYSDRLDELAVLHMELGRLTKRVNGIFSLFIFVWCWHRMTYLLGQLFFEFQVISTLLLVTDEAQQTTKGIDPKLNGGIPLFCGLAEAVLVMGDFYVVASICYGAEVEVSGLDWIKVCRISS